MNDENQKPMFQRTIETQAIVEFILGIQKTAEPHRVIFHTELAKAAGLSVDDSVYSSRLQSAKRILKNPKTYGLVVDAIRGQGITICNDGNIVDKAGTALPSIARKARRTIREMECIRNYQGLPPEKRVKADTAHTILEMTARTNSGPTIKKLESRIKPVGRQLELKETLAFFMGQSKDGK